MSPAQVVLLLVVAAVIAAAVVIGIRMQRSRKLQATFGDEYTRLVSEHETKAAAEKEMLDRQRRHAELDLRPLTPEARSRYADEWQEVQARFVDAPEDSVGAADEVVTRLVGEIGYPTGDYDDQVAQLSVDHARTLSAYRQAHEISERARRHEASVEELRQAVVQYRELVSELLGEEPVPPQRPQPTAESRPASRP
ncbi:MAG: hypothetical protein HOU81_19420 [Hamadaea sp.]|uniref:hypothetical protein n=1 Tax=Hamadaea sp. TaxID=2024425 RepID=UPI0017E3672D|nr:hypothetical protein [Hamadaea sp.]NUR72992.1 hypothetical protein [Hamadaea sp.]NUT21222.1 hypothetical protein [Hamadaea sp.]